MININLDRCLSFINTQTAPTTHTGTPVGMRRGVTINEQAGCGAGIIAEKMANYLQEHAPTPGVKWTIFDRQLMAKVLADHNLPGSLEKLLPEDRISRVQNLLADIFQVMPTENTMLKLLAETVFHLAELGNVIIVGRGANIVTARLPRVLHVRLVANLEDRIERVCHEYNKTPVEARHYCLEEDPARTRYLKAYFKADINDPLNYHLAINTSRFDHESTARMIGEALLRLP
ncbi:MAG TPA: cytidylate kinase-like family protein [Verrucomicrobiae bacterium]|nr:cytidylate kinase-like family protein [Verrucomicrobiae bacterium]